MKPKQIFADFSLKFKSNIDVQSVNTKQIFSNIFFGKILANLLKLFFRDVLDSFPFCEITTEFIPFYSIIVYFI